MTTQPDTKREPDPATTAATVRVATAADGDTYVELDTAGAAAPDNAPVGLTPETARRVGDQLQRAAAAAERDEL